MIEDLDIHQIRNHIQIIAHDQFFAGTIRENLTGLAIYREFTHTELREALQRVGMLENIEKLPEGLDTQIRPNGYPFTRSQLLALQMAKAILNQPRILFVTPDFESISTYKRRIIFNELLDKKNPWTLLFFTQRLHRGPFDRYVMLERSNMKELGDESALLKEIENG
jgi:ABC-type multidrug transport system fused ATPase/permease subunit